jgi:hypothetical protein
MEYIPKKLEDGLYLGFGEAKKLNCGSFVKELLLLSNRSWESINHLQSIRLITIKDIMRNENFSIKLQTLSECRTLEYTVRN